MAALKISFADTVNISTTAAAAIGITLYSRKHPISNFKKKLNKIFYLFCFGTLAMAVLGEIINMFAMFSVNFLAVTNVLPCICYCIISLSKFASIAANVDKSEKLLNDLENLWPTETLSDYENNIIIQTMTKVKAAQRFYTMITIAVGIIFDASSLIVLIIKYIQTGEVVKTLPYLIYMPWDTTGTYSYPLAYLYNLLTASVAFSGLIASDTFFVATIFHICTQFKLLSFRILCIVEESVPTSMHNSIDINHSYHQTMYEALIECVKRHSELIALSHTLEDLFSLSILFNFISSSIIICCVGFNSTAVTGVELVVFLVFMVVALYQIYLLCWAGNHLIETSREIANAAYNSSWYLTDKKFRQIIHMIILRAQRPVMVTALGFSALSFNSFSSILKSSYSYFTLLKTTYEKK